jgi:hypothetical protein
MVTARPLPMRGLSGAYRFATLHIVASFTGNDLFPKVISVLSCVISLNSASAIACRSALLSPGGVAVRLPLPGGALSRGVAARKTCVVHVHPGRNDRLMFTGSGGGVGPRLLTSGVRVRGLVVPRGVGLAGGG